MAGSQTLAFLLGVTTTIAALSLFRDGVTDAHAASTTRGSQAVTEVGASRAVPEGPIAAIAAGGWQANPPTCDSSVQCQIGETCATHLVHSPTTKRCVVDVSLAKDRARTPGPGT